MLRFLIVCLIKIYNWLSSKNTKKFLVEIGRVRKEMESEIAKRCQEIQRLNHFTNQKDREFEVATKSKEQSHQEEIEKLKQTKVRNVCVCFSMIVF